MKAGEVKTIPFNILVEGVPLTYRGEYLNIDHYVDVRIDIPWSLDPKASEEFLVLAGGIQEIEEPLKTGQNTSSTLFGCAMFALLAGLFAYLVSLQFEDEAAKMTGFCVALILQSLIHNSEPTRRTPIS